MSEAYLKARDMVVSQKPFISQVYSSHEEALALLTAIDVKRFKIGVNQLERRVLQIYDNSPEVYDSFIRGDYIKKLSSGNFHINLHQAEHDAKKQFKLTEYQPV